MCLFDTFIQQKTLSIFNKINSYLNLYVTNSQLKLLFVKLDSIIRFLESKKVTVQSAIIKNLGLILRFNNFVSWAHWQDNTLYYLHEIIFLTFQLTKIFFGGRHFY